MFYTYSQNNSGGRFFGPQYIIIEADSAREANMIAEDRTEIYFDGLVCYGYCDEESRDPYDSCGCMKDCMCCGERWNEVTEYDAKGTPSVYGETVDVGGGKFRFSTTHGHDGVVYFKES